MHAATPAQSSHVRSSYLAPPAHPGRLERYSGNSPSSGSRPSSPAPNAPDSTGGLTRTKRSCRRPSGPGGMARPTSPRENRECMNDTVGRRVAVPAASSYSTMASSSASPAASTAWPSLQATCGPSRLCAPSACQRGLARRARRRPPPSAPPTWSTPACGRSHRCRRHHHPPASRPYGTPGSSSGWPHSQNTSAAAVARLPAGRLAPAAAATAGAFAHNEPHRTQPYVMGASVASAATSAADAMKTFQLPTTGAAVRPPLVTTMRPPEAPTCVAPSTGPSVTPTLSAEGRRIIRRAP